MKLYKYAAIACVALAGASCADDLDVMPDDPQTKLELTTTEEWYGYLGSLYGAFLYEGNISTSDGAPAHTSAATGTCRKSPPTKPSS